MIALAGGLRLAAGIAAREGRGFGVRTRWSLESPGAAAPTSGQAATVP
jgi:hypothetical protein